MCFVIDLCFCNFSGLCFVICVCEIAVSCALSSVCDFFGVQFYVDTIENHRLDAN